jgi:thiosulfate/3-mercaptopyruvate sulfurtransferase
MRKILFGALALVASPVLFAQEMSILVTPQWLHEHKNDPSVVILQVNNMKLDYDQEHIEGARYLWPAWLAPDSPEGAMNVPDIARLNEVIGSLGISNESHVVLCHVRNEVSPTARMFLMFEYAGMKGKVSFLNGGLEAWKSSGYHVTTVVPLYSKAKFSAAVNPVIVDRFYVSERLHSPSAVIVDARMAQFYNGEATGNPRNGHIAGARNIPYPDLLDQSTNMFKPTDQLSQYFEPVASKDKELVTYCFIGQTASVVYMAGRLLGYPIKLYDGSMQEWSRIKELPMEATEKK